MGFVVVVGFDVECEKESSACLGFDGLVPLEPLALVVLGAEA